MLEYTKDITGNEYFVFSYKWVKKFGFKESFVLSLIHTQRNKVNKNGFDWVIASHKDFMEIFEGSFSESTLKRVLQKLKKEGYIIVDNLSDTRLDQTNWYRIDYDKTGGF